MTIFPSLTPVELSHQREICIVMSNEIWVYK